MTAPGVLRRRSVLLVAAAVALTRPAQGASTLANIVLLGDSILDNAAYVRTGEDVTAQLQRIAPPEMAVTLLAQDGAVLAGVERQLAALPGNATHLIVSAGGNDALRVASVLREPAGSMADAISRLGDIREQFAAAYAAMLEAVTAPGLPLALCTIYDAQFPDPAERRLAATALCLLNDVILREASVRRLPVIDLRVLFDEGSDYANAIEPSASGGGKIARIILGILLEHDFAAPAALYAGS